MQTTYKIKDKTKPFQLIKTIFFIYFNAITYSILPTNSCDNFFFFYFSNFIIKNLTLIFQYLKKNIYIFNKRKYTLY